MRSVLQSDCSVYIKNLLNLKPVYSFLLPSGKKIGIVQLCAAYLT